MLVGFALSVYITGLMLVSGSYDKTIVMWDVENRIQKIKLQVSHNDLYSIVLYKKSRLLTSLDK